MNKIYVVQAGEYSDREIYGVTTDYERAQDMQKKVTASTHYEAYIDEFEDGKFDPYWARLDNIVPTEYWEVRIRTNGHEPSVRKFMEFSGQTIQIYRTQCKGPWETDKRGYPRRELYDEYYVKYITAKDSDHALKIASDKIAEYIAQSEDI